MSYALLPFDFTRIPGTPKYLATNFAGESCLLSRDDLFGLVERRLSVDSDLYATLISKHFITSPDSTAPLHLLAAKYRTRRRFRPDLASLHIFVVTLRCNQACNYCQVSHRAQHEVDMDMPAATADAAVDFAFQGPAPAIKIEFQGGEPLLVFEIVRRVVEAAEERARRDQRTVEFVLCSNLYALQPDHLDYIAKHKIAVSTSLDGPQPLHDQNRIALGGASHEHVARSIGLTREHIGPDQVAALMTTTRSSLGQPEAIVDEYLRLGFRSIVLRPLNPYGFAARQWATLGYSTDEWLDFYRRALAYIIQVNQQGVLFREDFSAFFLRRMLTPFGDGYVDLQSPTGCGLSVLVYNHDGGIYLSDESRMLAAMGDHTFRFGTVGETRFSDFVLDPRFLALVDETMCEGMPECIECSFREYCGSDPVRQHRVSGDFVGSKAGADHCHRVRSVVGHLAELLDSNPTTRDVLMSWISP
jgi:His-Xaa-Ser repeat-associated upstream radical SAM protein